MSEPQHLYVIGYTWACTHPAIREINFMFADASVSLTPYVLGNTVDAIFEAAFPGDFPDQERIWKQNNDIQEDDIIIGEAEFIIYRANRLWMTQLYQEKILGLVSLSDPFPCSRYNFVDGVVPITYP